MEAEGNEFFGHRHLPEGGRETSLALKELLKMTHAHGVSVIVDAAGMTYPTSNFKMFSDLKADLVCYGGKYVHGPNATGFVTGRKDLIEAIALHSFIGAESGPDETPGKWRGIGHGYKMDRQSIASVTVAFQRWMKLDHEKERIEPAWARAHYIEKRIRKLPKLKEAMISFLPASEKGVSYHTLGVRVMFPNRTQDEVADIVKSLRQKDPEVWVRWFGTGNEFIVNALMLLPGEEKVVVERFQEVFG